METMLRHENGAGAFGKVPPPGFEVPLHPLGNSQVDRREAKEGSAAKTDTARSGSTHINKENQQSATSSQSTQAPVTAVQSEGWVSHWEPECKPEVMRRPSERGPILVSSSDTNDDDPSTHPLPGVEEDNSTTFQAGDFDSEEEEEALFLGNPSEDAMQQIVDRLYLGSCEAANSVEYLRKHDITHVLSVGYYHLSYCERTNPKHLILHVADHPSAYILEQFDAAFAFITQGLEGGHSVLVHCHRGVSRSSAIVIGYLMTHMGWTYPRAISHVQSKRMLAKPNVGFRMQLERFESQFKKCLDNDWSRVLDLDALLNTHTDMLLQRVRSLQHFTDDEVEQVTIPDAHRSAYFALIDRGTLRHFQTDRDEIGWDFGAMRTTELGKREIPPAVVDYLEKRSHLLLELRNRWTDLLMEFEHLAIYGVATRCYRLHDRNVAVQVLRAIGRDFFQVDVAEYYQLTVAE